MAKITFMGAGSTIFAKNILGDCMLTPALRDSRIALYDIDARRLDDSRRMLENLNANINAGRATITTHLGPRNRRKALDKADYVVNAIQVGGYKPSTVIDFEVPKKYGLRQTIADTLGIGGIFRTLRTVPVLLDFARDMEKACPDAWFINYTNPMAMVTGALLRAGVKAVGLCHSVQGCAACILSQVGMLEKVKRLRWNVAGINHQAWLLDVRDGKKDLYPELRRRAAARLRELRRKREKYWDLVRLEILNQFGYYVTESSEHSSEYCPWFIKRTHPKLIREYNIPLDEYPRRCVGQIQGWKGMRKALVADAKLDHRRTHEYGSYIMEAIETDAATRIYGNIANTGLITNLPAKACVEVPAMADRNGVRGCYVGDLPEPCAALNRTNINVQLLTLEAAFTRKREHIYQAAMLDPHTGAELSVDEIRALCDDLIKAHGKYLPKYR